MRASYALALSIVTAWIAVAVASGHSVWTDQTSAGLKAFGAVDGTLFQTNAWWRLLAAQWLHVRAPHMLFNAGLVALAGSALEPCIGAGRLLGLYLVGGSLGMLASVLAYPDLVSSGASQAALALAGEMLVCQRPVSRPSAVWLAVAAATMVQLGLDVASDAHMVKAGHVASLTFGMLAGAMLGRTGRRGG